MKRLCKTIKVHKSLATEIEEIANAYGISHIDASKLLLKKVKEKKTMGFYHL